MEIHMYINGDLVTVGEAREHEGLADLAPEASAPFATTYEPGQMVTRSQLAAAFTEWDRRWREEPESFKSDVERLLHDTPETYGEGAVDYFLEVLEDLRRDQLEAWLHELTLTAPFSDEWFEVWRILGASRNR